MYAYRYVRDLMGPTTAYLIEVASRNDLRTVAQQADAIHMVRKSSGCSCFFVSMTLRL